MNWWIAPGRMLWQSGYDLVAENRKRFTAHAGRVLGQLQMDVVSRAADQAMVSLCMFFVDSDNNHVHSAIAEICGHRWKQWSSTCVSLVCVRFGVSVCHERWKLTRDEMWCAKIIGVVCGETR